MVTRRGSFQVGKVKVDLTPVSCCQRVNVRQNFLSLYRQSKETSRIEKGPLLVVLFLFGKELFAGAQSAPSRSSFFGWEVFDLLVKADKASAYLPWVKLGTLTTEENNRCADTQ